jgi:hypothetical protein
MKRTPKVGDWIRRPVWSEFYEVAGVTSDRVEIVVHAGWGRTMAYPLNDVEWVFRDPEIPEVKPPKLDLTKPVQTRDGQPVRILCTDRPGSRCVVWMFEKCGTVNYAGLDGKAYGNDALDLVNVPPKPRKHTATVFLYLTNKGKLALITDHGPTMRPERILGKVEVTVNEGEGMGNSVPHLKTLTLGG